MMFSREGPTQRETCGQSFRLSFPPLIQHQLQNGKEFLSGNSVGIFFLNALPCDHFW